MSLQSAVPTAPYDHSPIFRGVPALVTFFHQLNMAIRFPKILFATTAPTFALYRFLSLHWSSRKHETADAGVRDAVSTAFFYGTAGLSLEQIDLGAREDLSAQLHMSAMGVFRQVTGSARSEDSAASFSESPTIRLLARPQIASKPCRRATAYPAHGPWGRSCGRQTAMDPRSALSAVLQ
jgi:hypothetical protein